MNAKEARAMTDVVRAKKHRKPLDDALEMIERAASQGNHGVRVFADANQMTAKVAEFEMALRDLGYSVRREQDRFTGMWHTTVWW
jgi:hypothetical protein